MRVFTIAALVAVAAGAVAGCGSSSQPTSVGACSAQHWITAWEAPPTDAIIPVDASLAPLVSGPDQTFRLILSPLGSGNVIRLRFSNRFGDVGVTFSAVRVALQAQVRSAALVQQSSVQVMFAGQASVTIPAGADIVSDPVNFPISGLENVAVSIAASSPTLLPTHHFEARQHSFATLPAAGDHSDDVDAGAFVQSTTSRPFVAALDVLTSAQNSTVVAFGDSLTDGHQGPATLVPQSTVTLDLNERYPDYLYRRLAAAGRSLFVANAGISGNLVLQDGLLPSFGPPAITRVGMDVLDDPGVSDVILFEGINDIGSTVGLTAQQLTDGYVELISEFHERGFNVIQGTLTPAGGNANPGYSSAQAEALRQQVNTWIRTQSPADSIVDFDAAVRDPNNPAVIAAQYDGGDGLHFNAAGYQLLANTLDLGALKGSNCP